MRTYFRLASLVALPFVLLASVEARSDQTGWGGSETTVSGSHAITGVGTLSDLKPGAGTNSSDLPMLKFDTFVFRRDTSDAPAVGLILSAGGEMNSAAGVRGSGRFGAAYGMMVPGAIRLRLGGEAEVAAYQNGVIVPTLSGVGEAAYSICSSYEKKDAICVRLGADVKLGLIKLQADAEARVYYTHRWNKAALELGPEANGTAFVSGGVSSGGGWGRALGAGASGMFNVGVTTTKGN
ncbi:MAG: hypothetical protein ACXWP5_05880 [Bdellovibrionota bacterium]